jgi:putative PIN family toxin of toxin-antitoxin system
MRVVLDTNVLIAAFAAQGLCHLVFELCLDRHRIVLSEHILKEVADNLDKKLRLPAKIISDIISTLRENSLVQEAEPLKEKVCRDPADDGILALAQQFLADYIITGDEDLLVLQEYASVPIVSPRRFWEILRDTEERTPS